LTTAIHQESVIKNLIVFDLDGTLAESKSALDAEMAQLLPRMDVIFCRNVLMYFSADQARRVIADFSHSLVAGGWLVVSQSELSSALSAQFAPVIFPDAILYQKKEAEPQTTPGTFNLRVEEASAPPPPLPEFFPLEGAEGSDAGATPTDYEKAAACYEQGRYHAAAELLLGLVGREPRNCPAITLLARACANSGDLDEALRWCERAVEADKLNAGVHFLRAAIMQEQHRTAEAVKSLRRALYLDQNFALAHFALGNLARGQGKLGESERHFANALTLLEAHAQEEVLPESEGMTAGRLAAVVRQAMGSEAA
jgi:chemotaxis protein methyltransferase CheR